MRGLKRFVLVVLGAFLLLLAATMIDRGVIFTVLLEDSRTLEGGDPLLLDDQPIGRVLFVVPRGSEPDEVVVRVATRHREQVHDALEFALERTPEGVSSDSGWCLRARPSGEQAEGLILKGESVVGQGVRGWPADGPRP